MFAFKAALLGFALIAQATQTVGCGHTDATAFNSTSQAQTELKDQGLQIYEQEASKITRNNELLQIGEYMHDMTQTGTVGYVTVYPPAAGGALKTYAVRGRVLSCDAQLTPSQTQTGGHPGDYYWNHDNPVVDQANDAGSYGGQSPTCVFFYTVAGVLIQTDNEYEYSSQPQVNQPAIITFKQVK